MDATLVRILTVVLTLFTGVPVVLYLVALFLMPEEDVAPTAPPVTGSDPVWGAGGPPWAQAPGTPGRRTTPRRGTSPPPRTTRRGARTARSEPVPAQGTRSVRPAPAGEELGPGDRVEQAAGVVGLRGGEDGVDAAPLDDPALLHDQHVVGELPHDGEVVGDEEVGQPEPVLQVGRAGSASAPGRARRGPRPPRRRPPAAGRGPARGRSPPAAAGRRRARWAGAAPASRAAPPGRAAPRPARRREARSPTRATRSGSSTMCSIEYVGSSEAYGSWNTGCMARRMARRRAPRAVSTTSPSIRTSPAVGPFEAEDHLRDRRLAGARLADHGRGRAPADAERHVVDAR